MVTIMLSKQANNTVCKINRDRDILNVFFLSLKSRQTTQYY